MQDTTPRPPASTHLRIAQAALADAQQNGMKCRCGHSFRGLDFYVATDLTGATVAACKGCALALMDGGGR